MEQSNTDQRLDACIVDRGMVPTYPVDLDTAGNLLEFAERPEPFEMN